MRVGGLIAVLLLAVFCNTSATAQNSPAVSAAEAVRRGRESISKHDYAAAMAWFRNGADQGNAEAQLYIGLMYSQGFGVSKDDAQAVSWFRKAAEQGNINAQTWLAIMYGMGQMGVSQDSRQAAFWWRKAAEQGSGLAQLKLGTAYVGGNGVPRDYTIAMSWFLKAADATLQPGELTDK